jgi:hypothetical protein
VLLVGLVGCGGAKKPATVSTASTAIDRSDPERMIVAMVDAVLKEDAEGAARYLADRATCALLVDGELRAACERVPAELHDVLARFEWPAGFDRSLLTYAIRVRPAEPWLDEPRLTEWIVAIEYEYQGRPPGTYQHRVATIERDGQHYVVGEAPRLLNVDGVEATLTTQITGFGVTADFTVACPDKVDLDRTHTFDCEVVMGSDSARVTVTIQKLVSPKEVHYTTDYRGLAPLFSGATP